MLMILSDLISKLQHKKYTPTITVRQSTHKTTIGTILATGWFFCPPSASESPLTRKQEDVKRESMVGETVPKEEESLVEKVLFIILGLARG